MVLKLNLHCLEKLLVVILSKHLRICVAFAVTCSERMNLVTDIVNGVIELTIQPIKIMQNSCHIGKLFVFRMSVSSSKYLE
jgi:hypothetical protein